MFTAIANRHPCEGDTQATRCKWLTTVSESSDWPDAFHQNIGGKVGNPRAPHPVLWLADSGSAYAARETLEFAAALVLVAGFTAERSLERKNYQMQLRQIQPRPDVATVLHMFPL